MRIESADIKDVQEILDPQKIAYLSEARIYDEYPIAPLTQAVEQMKKDFEKQPIFKAAIDGTVWIVIVVGIAVIGADTSVLAGPLSVASMVN